jgi:ABC-2 type transport system permease protein
MPAVLAAWRAPDPGAVLAGYVTLALLGAAVTAVGVLASAFTDAQLVALVLAFAATIMLWIVGWVDPDPTSVPSRLSLSRHVQDGLRGALRLSDLTYFGALVGWCLLAAWQRVAAWRYL